MFDIALQFVSIVFHHDYDPALTPWLMEDSPVFDVAYALMNALHR